MSPPNVLAHVLASAVEAGASDFHFGTFTGAQARIGGLIQPLKVPDELKDAMVPLMSVADKGHSLFAAINDMLKTFDGDNPLNQRLIHRLDALVADNSSPYRKSMADIEEVLRLGEMGNWRMSLYESDMEGFGVALRALPSKIPQLENLIPSSLLSLKAPLEALTKRKTGLFLTTGATGSGKSSTLAALVDLINRREKRLILTLEDPIEYWHASRESIVRHRQIGIDASSFADGLKGALRQDPDVIMIGELRDLETISLALRAAETGHFVLGTLHARDARSSITRIIETYPVEQQSMIRSQLAESLVGIISQQLLPVGGGRPGRVLHPELVIIPEGQGGIRATIQEGRFHQIAGTLEGLGKESTGCYYSFKQTLEMLTQGGNIIPESPAGNDRNVASDAPSGGFFKRLS